MTTITLEVLLILALIAANGLFAMSEIAVVSARKARLQHRAESGSRRARVALRLAGEPGEFLSTVQIGITLVGILTGVFGGAVVAEELGVTLDRFVWIAPHGESVAVAVVVLLITYVTVVFGELLPKQIGLANPERVATLIAPGMAMLSRVSKPVVWLLSASSAFMVRLLRVPRSRDENVTSEELSAMLRAATATGAFHPAEEEMVRGVFALGDRRADMVLRHRSEVVSLDVNAPAEELHRRIVESGYSRYPVVDGSLDHLIGIIDIRDLLPDLFAGRTPDLHAHIRSPLVVHEHTSALDVLRRLQERGEKFAVVADEFGSIEGIITVTDLAATVLGEEEGDITLREDGSLLIDGMTKFDVFSRHVPLPGVGQNDYPIVARFALARLGRLPVEGDTFNAGSWQFEIVRMEGRRIDRLAATKIAPRENDK